MAVRPGQRAHCPRCMQQERAGRAGTGRNGDRLTEGGGEWRDCRIGEGVAVRPGQRAHCPRI